jgi:hypothetical protein
MIPKQVQAHYLETRESERLWGAHGELEWLGTLEILARALPPARALIFDMGNFTSAYFHRPEELAAEVRECSFADCQIFAVEGPVWSTSHFTEAWDDPVRRKTLMEFLSLIEREPSAHGASAHLVAVAHAS